MAPNKHAALIHLWAEGATIQVFTDAARWRDCPGNRPQWDAAHQYRVKPKTPEVKQYRVGLVTSRKNPGTRFTASANDANEELLIESFPGFERWLTDWTPYDVPGGQ